MENKALRIDNISKSYRLGRFGARTLAEDIGNLFSGNKSREDRIMENDREESGGDYVWALRDVSMEVCKGDVVGIIGRNGAGKSTLLKLLSGITTPTSGRISYNGRIASLLEVGTGFHPELTGRENIFLNGAILGMKKAEIKSKLDEIIAFSGVSKYLDTPVKRYSSGMRVRLGFAVAAYLEPEILVVDEVLAVGDAEFQQKAVSKMQDVSNQQGRTVLFVSHNMLSIRRLCNRAVLLNKGKIESDGTTDEVVNAYLRGGDSGIDHGTGVIRWDEMHAPGKGELRLMEFSLKKQNGEPATGFSTSEPVCVSLRYRITEPVKNFRFVLQLLDFEENCVFSSTNQNENIREYLPGEYETHCIIPGDLLNENTYKIRIGAGIQGVKSLIDPVVLMHFRTLFTDSEDKPTYVRSRWPGMVAPQLTWRNI